MKFTEKSTEAAGWIPAIGGGFTWHGTKYVRVSMNEALADVVFSSNFTALGEDGFVVFCAKDCAEYIKQPFTIETD